MKKLLLFLLLLNGVVIADDDSWFGQKFSDHENQIPKVDNRLYQENCGDCHMAYQPALLPQQSWQILMQTEQLAEHFDDDASVEEADRQAILHYLQTHSPQGKHHSLRITEQAFFRDEHHEIPKKYVSNNPDVPSFAQCNVCHTKADDGLYEDDFVTIPNYGRWDD